MRPPVPARVARPGAAAAYPQLDLAGDQPNPADVGAVIALLTAPYGLAQQK